MCVTCLLRSTFVNTIRLLTVVNFLQRLSLVRILKKSLTISLWVIFLERLGYSQNFSRSLRLCVFEFDVIKLIIGLSPYWEREITQDGGLDVA